MFEERLKDILTDVYSGKVLVASNYAARETLFAKGLSPALFLHHFYQQPVKQNRVVFHVKERTVKELCALNPIDLEEYQAFKEDRMNKILRERLIGKSKLPKEIKKQDLCSKTKIEAYLKSLNFFWFQEAARTFLYCLSLEESNFRVSTLEQPLGLVFMIEIEPGANIKSEYEKVKKDAEIKLKKMFTLNTKRTNTLSLMVILMYNSEKGGSLEEMKSFQQALRVQYNLPPKMICLVQINGKDARDSVDWSSYSRILIKNQYKLKPSDPVRIIGQREESNIRQFVGHHRERIRLSVQDRLRVLCPRYEQNNTTKNRFFNFFKGTATDKSYQPEEIEAREIGDYLFLLGDFKKALEVFKDLHDKCTEGNRDSHIIYNLSEMIQMCKFMYAIQGGNKSKAYESIIKHAEKTMFKKAIGISKLKLYRYFVFIVFVLHGFKIFEKEFSKSVLYYYIKKAVNEEVWTENGVYPSPLPSLVHEQYANLNLLYPQPQPRRYAYDVIRVASKFNEFRLYDHHLRCLLIGDQVYAGSFPTLQKYINSSLSRTYYQLKKYRFCVQRIQLTWKILLSIYEDSKIQNQEDNQFTKLHSNQLKLLNEIEKIEPEELRRQTEDCIQVPLISQIMVEVKDEALEGGDGLGAKWQEVGDVFLGQTQLTSKGMNKKNLIKTLQLFDSFTPEEKELAYRFKNLPSAANGDISQGILKRNCRACFEGEPITVSFSMKNVIPLQIEISNIKLHLIGNKKCSVKLVSPSNEIIALKHGQKAEILFQIVPLEQGIFELSHISWTFFKMTSIYRFKQPKQSKSPMKSLYFKLNVVQKSGQLKPSIKHANKFYEGEETDITMILTNQGSEPIEQIYLAIDNEAVFGFRMKKLDLSVGVGEQGSVSFKIRLPILKSSDFSKIAIKAIFLYRTGKSFRVQRAVTSFNVHRVADIINLSCERISTTLHFLSFTVKYPTPQHQKLDLLKSMIIHRGMDIKKVETNQLGNLVHYFFFLRKNLQTETEEFKFTFHQFPSQKVIDQGFFKGQSEEESNLRLLFIWWDGQGRCGVVNPKPITITSTENSPSLVKLPFNAKVLLQDEVQCNFEEDVFEEVPVEFIIKNLFSSRDITVAVEFTDGAAHDFYWQGVTEHHLSLQFNEEKSIKLKLVAMRAGLFNVARNIRYTIMINKTNSYVLHHSDYEHIFLSVRDSGAINNFQFFQESIPSFKKPEVKQSQSLI